MFSDYIPSDFARSSAAILKFLLDGGLVRSDIASKNIQCRYNTSCRWVYCCLCLTLWIWLRYAKMYASTFSILLPLLNPLRYHLPSILPLGIARKQTPRLQWDVASHSQATRLNAFAWKDVSLFSHTCLHTLKRAGLSQKGAFAGLLFCSSYTLDNSEPRRREIHQALGPWRVIPRVYLRLTYFDLVYFSTPPQTT